MGHVAHGPTRTSNAENGESFVFNTADKIRYDLQKFNKPIEFEITFLSERGPLHKKPYRYIMTLTPWEQIKAQKARG